MQLRAMTNGSVSSTGTLTLKTGIVGGVIISTNNTNAAVVVLRRDNASGKQLFSMSTVTAVGVFAPIWMENTETLYYDISGTGASAQIYEWVS